MQENKDAKEMANGAWKALEYGFVSTNEQTGYLSKLFRPKRLNLNSLTTKRKGERESESR